MLEISLLKMFMWGLFYWEDVEYDWHLRFSFYTMMPKFNRLAKEFEEDHTYLTHFQEMNLEVLIHDLEEAIEQFRQQAKDTCIHLLGGSFKCTYTPSNHKEFGEFGKEIVTFVDLIQENLRDLQISNQMAPAMKQQIILIQRGLEEFGMFVDAPNRLFDLIPRLRAWLNCISCLTYLYWINGNDESLAFKMDTTLQFLLHKTVPCKTSGVISPHLQPSVIPQVLSHHLEFLLEGLLLPAGDDIEIFQEGLIFMLSFIMDADHVADSKDREIIWLQIYDIINKFLSLIYLLRSNEMKDEICKTCLSDFLMKVCGVKAKVTELFVVLPYSSHVTPPHTNVIGFLTALIENLKLRLEREMNLIHGLKHSCELVLIELVAFKPLLKSLVELQQHKKIKDLQKEAVNIVYEVDYLTKLCLFGRFSSWIAIIAHPDVRNSTKVIKALISKLVEVDKLYNRKKFGHPDQMEEIKASPPGVATFETERVTVGFVEVERVIIDELTRGQKSLRIVSISGSGGQGKTTLAKKFFNDPNVQYHFIKSIWCYVSKDCPVKEVLFQILSLSTKSGSVNEMRVEDLMERVWKFLKGRRYLIVMDDIWDIDAWGQLESSFPDDNNGSRILFTSRNQDLASQVKPNSISHPLPLFYDEESWELIKKKVFGPNDCDEEFVGMGKKITSYCKGLPLAVTLIAGVLKRTERNLDSWNKVAENMKTHLAQEGCRNVLELSYKFLPDHLKSCFLCFTTFQRGEEVGANKLKLLWIGEGFIIQDGDAKFSKEDLATKYLKDLVSQGLAVVTEMSSSGGIKRCNVHDLLYDLCLEKAIEDNFMHREDQSVEDDECNIRSSSHHRLCIGKNDPFINSNPMKTHSQLPISPIHSYLWSVSYYFPAIRLPTSFKVLTVLKLNLKLVTFPEVILSFIYLRHLELRSLNTVRIVPPTISNLWRLETFIFHPLEHVGWDVTFLPLSM